MKIGHKAIADPSKGIKVHESDSKKQNQMSSTRMRVK